MKILKWGACLGLFLTFNGRVQAGGWLSLEGGRAEDYRLGGLSGGGNFGEGEAWSWQAAVLQSLAVLADDGRQLQTSELDAGLGYDLGEHWDIELDGRGGRDSTDMRFGGGSAGLGAHAGSGSLRAALTLLGGSTHYSFTPEETLRQNKGAAELSLRVAPALTLGASAGAYNYNRDLYRPGGSTTSSSSVVNSGPGGIFGFLGQGSTVTTMTTTTSSSPGEPQLDPLLSGFPSREWTARLGLEASPETRFGAHYTQIEIIETGAWDKLVGAFWRQEWGGMLSSKASWSKAVEGGSDSPYFSLVLAWDFD